MLHPYIVQCISNKCQRIPKGQSEMNNPEKPATYGEQDEEKQNKNKERLYAGDIPHRLCNSYPAHLVRGRS